MGLDTFRTEAFALDEAERLALDLFGVRGRATSLPGEHDENLHIRTTEGPGVVLKVMHPSRAQGLVDLQCGVLRHLESTVPDLALPRVVATREGSPSVIVTDAAGGKRIAWMLSYLPGRPLAACRPAPPALLADLGRFLGRLTQGFVGFDHPEADRDLRWDLAGARWVGERLDLFDDAERSTLAKKLFRLFEDAVEPRLSELRRSVIYGDANDYNVLASEDPWTPKVVGLVDFGDMQRTITVAEVAVAAAYALLDKPDPIGAACDVVAGFHEVFPLEEREIALLHGLVVTRLLISVTNSAHRKRQHPEDPYVTISEAPAWRALEALSGVPADLAHYRFRAACRMSPVPATTRVVSFLETSGPFAPIVGASDGSSRATVLELGVSSLLLGADPAAAQTEPLTRAIFDAMKEAGADLGVGRYNEARALYASDLFGDGPPTRERRCIHLGVDLFVPPGSAVRAPVAGVVHVLANNKARLDYGPLVILRHETDDGLAFFTLYGHLGADALERLAVGQHIERGETFATVGSPPSNGDWPPHVHFQVITDLLGLGADFPGVAYARERDVWTALSPDPNVILRLSETVRAPHEAVAESLDRRRTLIGASVRVSYAKPLKIVRGFMQHLYDHEGRAYLDMYNNVPLVGHSHPKVVAAVSRQASLLTTNTRYLHDNVNRYAERLTALMPDPLRVCFFVNSGSEANELALRLAWTHTRRRNVVVLENAYHGHTSTLIDVSPYKFNGPGGAGRKPWVFVAPMPDDYRGAYRRADPAAGAKHASDTAAVVERAKAGEGFAAFLAETLPSVGGQIVPPSGYFAGVEKAVRAAGGVMIADEVQCGFGRLGSAFWGFEAQGFVPDVVVLGKPIGNGHPLGAVVTTREIAASFDNGMEFFSTFGGNPVACAAGLAVLDVLQDEGLPRNAERVGGLLLARLRSLMDRHEIVGDVRGQGLFLGVELVRDRATLEPAAREAGYVVNRLRENGILTGTDGPHHNVIKIRPSLVLTSEDADLFVRALDDVLAEDPLRF